MPECGRMRWAVNGWRQLTSVKSAAAEVSIKISKTKVADLRAALGGRHILSILRSCLVCPLCGHWAGLDGTWTGSDAQPMQPVSLQARSPSPPPMWRQHYLQILRSDWVSGLLDSGAIFNARPMRTDIPCLWKIVTTNRFLISQPSTRLNLHPLLPRWVTQLIWFKSDIRVTFELSEICFLFQNAPKGLGVL